MMVTYQQLCSGEGKIAVVGLGYVGFPLAVSLSREYQVIGYDCDTEKILRLRKGTETRFHLTDQESDLSGARVYIIAVPTPVTADFKPDLRDLCRASETVGEQMRPGSVVVYESTVYPGVTEQKCIPILQRASGLRCGKDFFVGYSPERVNPGDPEHQIETVAKVVSGVDAGTARLLCQMYGRIVQAEIHCAPDIQTAEAAKLLENVQRDVNIGLINELSRLFDRQGIDTLQVLRAAATKWNFAPYQPGLVGGHCIGVDSCYLLESAAHCGCALNVVRAARESNRETALHVARSAASLLQSLGIELPSAAVAVAGFTFKEDVADVRSTGAAGVVRELCRLGVRPQVCDPAADPDVVLREYGIELTPFDQLEDLDALIFAVRHRQYRNLTPGQLEPLFRTGNRVLIDVKGMFSRTQMEEHGYHYWRL